MRGDGLLRLSDRLTRSTDEPDRQRAPAVDAIVETALGRGVRSIDRPVAGSVADTWLVELDGGSCDRVVCKRGGESVWTGDLIEPLVVDRVADRTALPVPAVRASGSIIGGEPERWALYEYLEGTNPGPQYHRLNTDVRRRLVAEAGEALGRLHGASSAFDLPIESPEDDRSSPCRVGGLYTDGRDLRLRSPDGWHAIESQSASVPVALAGDPDCRPVLTHGDYQPSNLLVDDRGRLTAVLDWGNAHVTHAGYALARAEVRFVDSHVRWLDRTEREYLRRTFREAYTEHAPIPIADRRAFSTYKLLWIAQSIANYAHVARTPRGRRQLRRQCASLVEAIVSDPLR